MCSYRESMDLRLFEGALLLCSLFASGCFDPGDAPASIPSGQSSGGSADPGPDTTSASNTTASNDPTLPASSTGEGDPRPETDSGEDTGPPPECSSNDDCTNEAGECELVICTELGTCAVQAAVEGTPCGDTSETQCDRADTCDGNGTCSSNLAIDGSDCSECDSGPCTCTAGSCNACVVHADTNLFSTERSLAGWELTGDWGLYTAAPASLGQDTGSLDPQIPFNNQALGTDGNRHGPAYPGDHAEVSYARTPPTELPVALEFRSWHLDEGSGAYDNKAVRISTDGGETWTDIITCDLLPDLPFCQQVTERAGDDWDLISVDLPVPLIGQTGIIEFSYDTDDACCNFEKGWFIDVTNFATECACSTNEVCAPYGSACGTGVCGGNGGCNLDAEAAGTACGRDDANTCTEADACDGFGYCQRNDTYATFEGGPETQIIDCDFCDAGDDCIGCGGGVCQDCEDLPAFETFDVSPVSPTADWTFETTAGGSWGVFISISNNEDDEGTLFSSNAPFLGIDGSYLSPGNGMGEVNDATATTSADVLPETLQFASWHQDEGGSSQDGKTIELSVDGGLTWVAVADCSGPGPLSAFPFCTFVDDRDAEDWDEITIDIPDHAGMTGQLRFSYRTGNACCGFERGWYIDDLNFAQVCDAANPSLP